MQLILKCVYKDGTEQVTVTKLFTTILWERKFKTKLSKVEKEGMGQEEITFLAYESLKEDDIKVPADFESFAKLLTTCLPIEANNPKVDAVVTAMD